MASSDDDDDPPAAAPQPSTPAPYAVPVGPMVLTAPGGSGGTALPSASMPLVDSAAALSRVFRGGPVNDGRTLARRASEAIIASIDVKEDAQTFLGAMTNWRGTVRENVRAALGLGIAAGRDALRRSAADGRGTGWDDQVIQQMETDADEMWRGTATSPFGIAGLRQRFKAVMDGMKKVVLNPLDPALSRYGSFSGD